MKNENKIKSQINEQNKHKQEHDSNKETHITRQVINRNLNQARPGIRFPVNARGGH